MAYDRDNGSSINGDGAGFETPPQLLSPVPRGPLYADGGAANGHMSSRSVAAGNPRAASRQGPGMASGSTPSGLSLLILHASDCSMISTKLFVSGEPVG